MIHNTVFTHTRAWGVSIGARLARFGAALAVLLAYLGLTPIRASAATIYVVLPISSNQTWTSGNVYVLLDNVQVQTGVTLTIEAGVIVKLATGRYLDVFGTLDLQGTPGSKIVFTSLRDDSIGGDTNGDLSSTVPAAGDWDAIYLENSLTTFDYAIVRFATRGLSIYNQTGTTISPEVASSTFSDNVAGLYLFMASSGGIGSSIHDNSFTHNGYGLAVAAGPAATGTASPTLANNDFNNTTGFPLYLGASAFPSYSGNTFVTNSHPAIALGGTFVASGTWPVVNAMPYVVIENTTITATAVVTLPVNTVIKFDRGHYLSVRGGLILQSTALTPPIVFTSYWDDVYGGDTNGDGVCPSCTLEPQPGDWEALYLESDATDFEYGVVRYAARGLSVYNAGPTDFAPVIAHNTFDKNQTGLYLFSGGDGQVTPAVMTNTFTNQTTGFPIYLDGTAYPLYVGNTFVNNLHPAIGVKGTFRHSGSWPLINNMPYVLDGNTTLTATATLTLPVGTVVKAAAGRNLDVFGTLDLQSSASTAPIVFTSFKDDSYAGDTNGDGGTTQPARGDWEAVYLEGSGTRFDFARVQYASRGVSIYNTGILTLTPPITSTTFSQDIYGVFLYAGAGDIASLIQGNHFVSNTYGLGTATNGAAGRTSYPHLQNNTFTNSSGFPIFLGGSAFPIYDGNVFANNAHPAIALGGYFNDSGSWPLIDSMPYVVIEDTHVNANVALTLPVGTILKFDTGRFLEAHGVLDLQSTPATQPIIFTSYKDDAYAGDTNGDGGAAQPARGDWDAVYLEHNDMTFDYATVKYANRGVSIYTTCGCTVLSPTVSFNTFVDNVFGVFLYSGLADITSPIQNNTFLNNTYGLGTVTNGAAGYTSYPKLANNSFTGHSGFPIYLGGSAFPEYGNNTFSNNAHPAIALGGYFNDSGVWPIINNMPYVVKDDVFIHPLATVAVPASEVIKLDLDRYLHVYGVLDLQSSGATQPIVFTSYRDDTHAGDTNGDGNATTPAASDWKTIWLYSSGTTFDYAQVDYATAGVGVHYAGPANTNIFPAISHNTFTHNLASLLLSIGYDSQDTTSGKGNITSLIDNNVFVSSGYGLVTFAHPSSTGSALPTLTDNSFTNHSGFPIYLGGTAFPIYTGSVMPDQAPAGPEASSPQEAAPELPERAVVVQPSDAFEVIGDRATASPSAPTEAPAAGNVFADNVHPAIALAGSFNSTGTWSRVATMPYVVVGDYPIIVDGLQASPDVRVGAGAAVSLPPGTVLKFGHARYLDVFGGLDLLGSPSNPILFTSYQDDASGGDTNADGTTTSPARSDWRAVYLESSNTIFDNGVVKYSDEGVQVYYNGALNTNIFPEIAHSYFLENNIGLSFHAATNGDITSFVHDNVLANNNTHVRGTTGGASGRLLMTLTDNDFYGNKSGPMGVNELSAASTITATMNWWGDGSGPFHSSLNPGGQGVPVSDYVNFIPWRGGPSQVTTTFSVLGRVVDDSVPNPQPITGVTLNLSTGVTTTTNAGGYYTFPGLPFGNYTVTPSLSGYAFVPAARTVTLPADATNVDFFGSLVVGPGTYQVFLPLMLR